MAYSSAFSQSIEILIYIYYKSTNEHYEYLSTKAIANSLGIPAPTVSKVIQKLVLAHILESKEGQRGGLALAKDLKNITLYDVFAACGHGEQPLFRIHSEVNIANPLAGVVLNNIKNVVEECQEGLKKQLMEIPILSLLKQ